jgi:hypothetical protein
MKEVIDNLNKKFHEFCNLERDYQNAIDAIAKLPYVPTQQAIINDLKKERDKADTKMKECFDAINALRKVCTHTFPNGYPAFETISENVEMCSICGHEIKKRT